MTRSEQAELWAQRIATWKSSELSRRAFCAREGLSYDTHRRWTYRLDEAGRQAESSSRPRLVPIRIAARGSRPASALQANGEGWPNRSSFVWTVGERSCWVRGSTRRRSCE